MTALQQPAPSAAAPQETAHSGLQVPAPQEDLSAPLLLRRDEGQSLFGSVEQGGHESLGFTEARIVGKGLFNTLHARIEADPSDGQNTIVLTDGATGEKISYRERVKEILENGDTRAHFAAVHDSETGGVVQAERLTPMSLMAIDEAEEAPQRITSLGIAHRDGTDHRYLELGYLNASGEEHRIAIRSSESAPALRSNRFAELQSLESLSGSIAGKENRANALFLKFLARTHEGFDPSAVNSIAQTKGFAKPNFNLAAWTETDTESGTEALKLKFDSGSSAEGGEIIDLRERADLIVGHSEGFGGTTEIQSVEGITVKSNGASGAAQQLFYEIAVKDRDGNDHTIMVKRDSGPPEQSEPLQPVSPQPPAPAPAETPAPAAQEPEPAAQQVAVEQPRRGLRALLGRIIPKRTRSRIAAGAAAVVAVAGIGIGISNLFSRTSSVSRAEPVPQLTGESGQSPEPVPAAEVTTAHSTRVDSRSEKTLPTERSEASDTVRTPESTRSAETPEPESTDAVQQAAAAPQPSPQRRTPELVQGLQGLAAESRNIFFSVVSNAGEHLRDFSLRSPAPQQESPLQHQQVLEPTESVQTGPQSSDDRIAELQETVRRSAEGTDESLPEPPRTFWSNPEDFYTDGRRRLVETPFTLAPDALYSAPEEDGAGSAQSGALHQFQIPAARLYQQSGPIELFSTDGEELYSRGGEEAP